MAAPKPIPTSRVQAAARTALNAFRQSQQPGVWLHLDKAEIIQEMGARLNNPYSLNQGPQPFCGPASIVFELLRKFPLQYVAMVQSLYETGGFPSRGRHIYTSENLRQASQGKLHIGPADWMLLAALRESENLIFPVEPNAPEMIRNLAGMTKSWEMLGWVREILGYDHADYLHTYVLRDLSALRKSQAILDRGGVAFGLITADSLLSDRPVKVTVPNHWVALVGNIEIQKGTPGQHDSGRVSFDLFSWAKKMHVDIGEGQFEDGFWGVVLGW